MTESPAVHALWRTLRKQWGKATLLILTCAWILIPYYFLFIVSITKKGTTVDGFNLPKFLTLDNYHVIVQGANSIWPSLINSAIVGISATIISLIFAIPAAYGLSRLRHLASARAMYLSFFVLRGIPPVSLVIPYYLMFSSAGLLNSLVGLTLALVTLALPFAVWTLRVFFDAIPIELEEAARIDGASQLQTFIFVALPVVRQGIAATGILSALLVFVDYIFCATLAGPDTRVFSVYVTSFQQDYVTLVGPLAAAAGIGTLPMIVLYTFSQRYMQRMAIAGIH